MPESTNNFQSLNPEANISWKLGPRDFVFKYIKFAPWILFCALIGLILAYVKLRYEIKIYAVQSSMLINSGRGGSRMMPDLMNYSWVRKAPT